MRFTRPLAYVALAGAFTLIATVTARAAETHMM
jgi:hypothetical protein